MTRTKKAARFNNRHAGGRDDGDGRSPQKKKKKKPQQNTNKQSNKQRIRAEAAERSRLSRKANQALQRRVEREAEEEAATTAAAAAAAAESPLGPGPDAAPAPRANSSSNGENSSALATQTPTSRAKQREAVQQDVEARLSVWRRKRARAEAGLPADPRDTGNNNNPDNNPERSSFFPTAYYPEQAAAAAAAADRAGGALPLPGVSGSGSRSRSGSGAAMVRQAWPDVYNAPVRQCLPGNGRNLVGGRLSYSSAGGNGGGGGGGSGGGKGWALEDRRSDEARREVEERWEAPWMLGLVDRSPDGGVGAGVGGGGDTVEPVDLVSSDDEDGHVEGVMHADGAEELQRGSEGRNANALQSRDAAGNDQKHAATDARKCDFGPAGGRLELATSADEALSDLHHELLRFEEYVSLTPAEVRAREGLVASIEVTAEKALGYGATARSFGSYGGRRTRGQSDCFSIFLSDVDISVRPPADPGALPPQGQEFSTAKLQVPPRARTTLGGFLDLSRGSDDGFEEGSSSSSTGTSSASSSSSSSSASDSDTDSESGSDLDNSNRPVGSTAAGSPRAATTVSAAAAAAEAIYVASSGSEAEAGDDLQEESRENRPREATTRLPNGADDEAETPPAATACGGGDNDGDGGSGGRGGGTAESAQKAGTEQQAGTERNGPPTAEVAATEEVLGFYVDRRPDPELLKLVAKEREAAIADTKSNGGAGGEKSSTQGENHGEEQSSGRSSGSRSGGRGCKGKKTARMACGDSSSSGLSPKSEGKGKKRPRSSSPSSMRSLGTSVGDGGTRLSVETTDDDGGDREGTGERLRVVFDPIQGRRVFSVKSTGKGSDDNIDPQDGVGRKEKEEKTNNGATRSATSSLQQKDGSADASGPAAATLDDMAAAASGPGETAEQIARRLRAESERTARLTADAASLAAKLSWSAGVIGATADERSTAALPCAASARFASEKGNGSGEGGDGASRSGSKSPDQVDSVKGKSKGKGKGKGKDTGTPGESGAAKGDGNGGDGKGEQHEILAGEEGEEEEGGQEDGEEQEGEGEKAKHEVDGLMALVREQERRNRGGSLPPSFVPTVSGQGEGRPGETSSRAARLQAALTVAAGAAAKRRRSTGTVAPPGGALEIRARPELAIRGRGGGVPWRGGQSGAKERAVAGLRKLGKLLRKMPWVKKFEFRSRARVPIIAMLDARGGVECDVGWGGGDGLDDPADAPGPAYFADMFPGTFRPLTLFLKVFMRQRGLDKPFTGGLGSFKLYALVAFHLQACGCGRGQQQRDLGDLLLSFLRRYSVASKQRVSPTTVLCINGLRVDFRPNTMMPVASKDFTQAFEALSLAVEEAVEEANHATSNMMTAAPMASPGGPSEKSSDDSHRHNLEGNAKRKRSGESGRAGGSTNGNIGDGGLDVESRHRNPKEHGDVRKRRGRRSSVLGRVIWGSDLRRERESRLAAVGCAKTSPDPACAEPRWHVKLEEAYDPDAGKGAGQRHNNKHLSGKLRFPWAMTPPRSRTPTTSGQGHRYNMGGGPSASNHWAATKPRGGGGGAGGGHDAMRWGGPPHGVVMNKVQQRKKPAWTKAQKKRARLKRDAGEIEARRLKKRGFPNAHAAAGGAKTKKRKRGAAGGASSGHGAPVGRNR
eukprot:g8472.t1